MKFRRQSLSLLVAIAFAVSGCGTLFGGNPQVVEITSDPAGASVFINGQHHGMTPLEVALDTRSTYEITVEASGYPAATRMLTSSLAVGYIVADVLFGLVPLVIDIATNSLHELEPGDMHFQFAERRRERSSGPALELNIGSQPLLQPHEPGRRQADQGSSNAYCCLNRVYYECPSAMAAARCAPPQLATCMMSCGMGDFGCPDECMRKHQPDPSGCRREPAGDASCQR